MASQSHPLLRFWPRGQCRCRNCFNMVEERAREDKDNIQSRTEIRFITSSAGFGGIYIWPAPFLSDTRHTMSYTPFDFFASLHRQGRIHCIFKGVHAHKAGRKAWGRRRGEYATFSRRMGACYAVLERSVGEEDGRWPL